MKKIIITMSVSLIVILSWGVIMYVDGYKQGFDDKWEDRIHFYDWGYRTGQMDCANAGCSWADVNEEGHQLLRFGWPSKDNR